MAGKRTDGPVSRYINRHFSSRITSFIIRHNIGLSPNGASLISFFVGIVGGLFYLWLWPLWAGILVQMSSILDGVDGEIARATGKCSKKGAFFDTVLDRIVDITVILCLSLMVMFVYCGSWILDILNQGWSIIKPYIPVSIPALSAQGIIVVWMFFALSGTIMVSYIHAAGSRNLGVHPLLVGKVPSLASRDVRLFIIFLGSVLGWIFSPRIYMDTLVLIAILTWTYVLLKFVDILHSYRENSIQKTAN